MKEKYASIFAIGKELWAWCDLQHPKYLLNPRWGSDGNIHIYSMGCNPWLLLFKPFRLPYKLAGLQLGKNTYCQSNKVVNQPLYLVPVSTDITLASYFLNIPL